MTLVLALMLSLFAGLDAGLVPVRAHAEDDLYSATETTYITLQLGDRDSDDGLARIVPLQNRLIMLGYLRDSADGIYGENTKTAVEKFQANNGLMATGVADSGTQAKLFSDMSTLVEAPEDEEVKGSDLYRTQVMLAQWGFLGGLVDGQYGKETSTAIKRFKEYMKELDPEYGITPTPAPTPTPEPHTLFGDMPAAPDEPIIPDVTPAPLDGKVDSALLEYVDGVCAFEVYHADVRRGDKGIEALRVQNRLKQLRYLYTADGTFGAVSETALKYFQKKHELPETGVADETTQRILFSSRALRSEEYIFPYKLVVSISKQRVYVGEWDGESYENNVIHAFVCSTGAKGTPTPLGTYQAGGQSGAEWYYFQQSDCYARWAYHIVGGILFHSVLYTTKGKLMKGTVDALGKRASHGCIRLSEEDAKWIYDNCPPGTTVVIREE